MMLDYERLDVYRCSLEFLAVALRLTSRMPKGYAYLGDQLRRAATGIPLNIAEGSGKVTLADRARFHAIARGSAMECGALADIVRILGLANEPEVTEAKNLVVRIVSMLSKMCH